MSTDSGRIGRSRVACRAIFRGIYDRNTKARALLRCTESGEVPKQYLKTRQA